MCSHPVYGRLGYICDQQVHERLSPFSWYCYGDLGNIVSSFGPTPFHKNSQKLERMQRRGHKFQFGKFRLDITLHEVGSATLEQRGDGMSILWSLQGSPTKPLTLSGLYNHSIGSRLDYDDFLMVLPTSNSEITGVTPEFQVKPLENWEYRKYKLWDKIWNRRKFPYLLSHVRAIIPLLLHWSWSSCWQRWAGWWKTTPTIPSKLNCQSHQINPLCVVDFYTHSETYKGEKWQRRRHTTTIL